MFSVMFVCSQGELESHVTINHDALDLNVQSPSRHGTPLYKTHPSLPRHGTSL